MNTVVSILLQTVPVAQFVLSFSFAFLFFPSLFIRGRIGDLLFCLSSILCLFSGMVLVIAFIAYQDFDRIFDLYSRRIEYMLKLFVVSDAWRIAALAFIVLLVIVLIVKISKLRRR